MGKPTVVVLMAGSAIDLTGAQDRADGVLLAWYPGAGGGQAVADLLFGKVSPSGKLPVTFYRNTALAEIPAFTDYSMTQRTYRYYTGSPLYPFGYGLTYGNVVVTDVEAGKDEVKVTAQNRGNFATEDVIQVYVKDNVSADAPTNPILCGFQRIGLNAGEAKQVVIPLDKAGFTVVNQAGHRIAGSGSWTLYVHTGQPDAKTEELTGKKAYSVLLCDAGGKV